MGLRRDFQQVYETALFDRLNTIRNDLAELNGVSPQSVVSDTTLVEIATYLPQTRDEFWRISGFDKRKIEKYENYFREAVVAYCTKHNLASRVHLKNPPRQNNFDTKQFTLDLFNDGYSIDEIAARRGLKKGTIETHLAHYVREGTLTLEQLLPREKIEAIMSALGGDSSLTAIRKRLGDDFSYGEIRMVMAHRDLLSEREYVS